MQRCFVMLSVLFAGAAPVLGAGKEFDFKDPKGVNTMSFFLDSLLEPIMGVASDISGTVTFDPEHPDRTAGTITVEAKSLHTPNGGMKRKLQAEDWLNVREHPVISFTIKRVEGVEQTAKQVWSLGAVGDFTCKGVTKEMIIPVKVAYLPGRMADRGGRQGDGDLLVLRSDFSIKRTDFDIKKDMGDETVANEIQIRVSIVGGSPKK